MGTAAGQELIGIIQDGKIKLPASVRLPDGTRVRVILEPVEERGQAPLELEPLDDREVEADLAWADGQRFPS